MKVPQVCRSAAAGGLGLCLGLGARRYFVLAARPHRKKPRAAVAVARG